MTILNAVTEKLATRPFQSPESQEKIGEIIQALGVIKEKIKSRLSRAINPKSTRHLVHEESGEFLCQGCNGTAMEAMRCLSDTLPLYEFLHKKGDPIWHDQRLIVDAVKECAGGIIKETVTDKDGDRKVVGGMITT
ncbi:hypothetical protein HOG17_01055 [Candidatus Peregrinibacteria bacterium]|jgi:hypothetical protein|nr:hypothetical protein [Candidatus Peregrinibacteria bacterium]MBT4148698.1 hypothetical protein [Candidatus Peregrinibacteria bacterium]MBT4366143.1 hypothetical protein [Candidatus Peregrinibacteria bacterium]MBT4456303.1 hypothetical protein [Candidatus Peregrinibacteria bacterium]